MLKFITVVGNIVGFMFILPETESEKNMLLIFSTVEMEKKKQYFFNQMYTKLLDIVRMLFFFINGRYKCLSGRQ